MLVSRLDFDGHVLPVGYTVDEQVIVLSSLIILTLAVNHFVKRAIFVRYVAGPVIKHSVDVDRFTVPALVRNRI